MFKLVQGSLLQAGDNALIVACRNGHLGVAQSLVLKGAEPASVNHRVSGALWSMLGCSL